MKQLVLRNTTYEWIYRSLGVVWIVILIVIIVTGEVRTWNFWLQVFLLLLLAVGFLSLNFGTLVNRLTADKGMLTIRWYSKTIKRIIRIDEIQEIRADENYIRIIIKTGRTVHLSTRMLDFNEKHAVRKFLKEVTGF
jgi:uncharacterized membrane protein YjjP (DUF1212 family)